MTPEEKAVAIATLRFGGCHPDWIIWFARPGEEQNLRFVENLFNGNPNNVVTGLIAEDYMIEPGHDIVLAYARSQRK